MESTEIYTITEFAKINKQNGTWPGNDLTLRRLRRNSDKNGFKSAFIKIGGKVLIDAKEFQKCINKNKIQGD